MTGELLYLDDKKAHIGSGLSNYQPPQGVSDLTFLVKKAYQDGRNVQEYPFRELNNLSLIQRDSQDKRAWLSWNPEPYEGEADWRWNGVRPLTRNKVISTAAHLTAQLIIPNAFAQNEFDEEDRGAANVMRDLLEYNIRRSNYETAFLFGVISGLVSPLTFFKVDYTRGWQEIWQEDKRQTIVDDVLSGFQSSLIPMDDMLFGNMFVYEWQKQDWIIEKGYVSYGNALGECGQHENFVHVQAGRKTILHSDGHFYDVDDVNEDLVERVLFKSRTKDLEVKYMGGIYMGNPNPDFNPFLHRTNKNKPKYNTVKFGYEPIDAMRFAAYKSLVAKMSNDQEAADRQWALFFDSSYISTFPPTITMGAGKLDKSVIKPAMNTDLPRDATFQTVDITNPDFALQALREAERSLVESSQSEQAAGREGAHQKTARESILLQQNQQTNLGLAAKMIGVMVKNIGELMVDDIIRYQSIGELSEITGELTYKTFLLDGKIAGGRSKTSNIVFTNRFAGQAMDEDTKAMEEYKLLEKAGDDRTIYEVNPLAFSRMEYLITIDAEKMLQRNEAFERAFKLETYDRAIRNPLVQRDLEAQQKITRDFLFEPLMKGEASEYLPSLVKVANSLVPPSAEGGDKEGLPSRIGRSAAVEDLGLIV